jgi:2-polyprenyl-6-methoxyphenol hydroxylase-like FAD-dependent oxidoreductase
VMTGTGEDSIRAQYLIGADGGRSFVRHTLGSVLPRHASVAGDPGASAGCSCGRPGAGCTGPAGRHWTLFGYEVCGFTSSGRARRSDR